MTPLVLRKLWSIVDSMQTTTLLCLDDDSLVHCLAQELRREASLPEPELDALDGYLYAKLSLIRDLASDRQDLWRGNYALSRA